MSRRSAWMGTASLLAAMVSLVGCNDAGEPDSPRNGGDSGQVVNPDDGRNSRASPPLPPEVALRSALEQLLRGDAERTSEGSWFSPATEGALRAVSLDTTGHAIVDFADLRTLIPNASSSAGSALLLEELNATVFSVAAVRSVDYQMEGRCELFWEWLQRGCQIVRRPG